MSSTPTIVLIDTWNGASAGSPRDRGEPDLDVAVFRHVFRRRPVLAMAGDRRIAHIADGDRAAVALGLDLAARRVAELEVEAGVAVENRQRAIAGGRRDSRPRPGRGRRKRRRDRWFARCPAGRSGTRSGASPNGGEMSTPATALFFIAMRIVRVMLALAAVVAKVAGEMRPSTMRATAGRGAARIADEAAPAR